MGALFCHLPASMQATVLFFVIAFASTSHSLTDDEIKGRSFLWTYPSHTYPLDNRNNDRPKFNKVRRGPTTALEPSIEETTTVDFITQGLSEISTESIEDSTTIDVDTQKVRKETDLARQAEDDTERIRKSLINQFPYHQQERRSNHLTKHTLRNTDKDSTSALATVKATDLLDQISSAEADSSGRKCINKVMMREETEYDEILTCDHSYDKRCHTSYVTKYEPHQEQECDEKFRKVCSIEYEQKAVHEMVQVCITPFVKDCDMEGDEVCQTVYESTCSTIQIAHYVEDDVANCKTEEEKRCQDVTEGFKTVNKCDTWPVEKCTLEKMKVKKFTPETSCKKMPKKMCSPKGCGIKEGPVQCQDKVKTVIVDSPIEECDMEPLRTCKHITKLVPKLEPTQECVDVPKEICARSKVNPKKVKK